MLKQYFLTIQTSGRSLTNMTSKIAECVKQANVNTGLCNIFLHHTSASLILCENEDPAVLTDLENFMQRIAPDDAKQYAHHIEGPDDMPSHIRSVLTQNSITVPITKSILALGTWQGIYLWEHRVKSHSRKMTITITE